ncbi:MAG: hypothetical protein ACU83N_09295 [Gammaproteobacteria bacterium]
MKQKTTFIGGGIVALLAGCAYLPTGPSVMALPGTGMSFDQFRQDDYLCRQYAYGQVGGVTANQAAIDSQVGSAVVGSALGAAAGAAIGGGEGAAIGAGTGLVAGSMVGAGEGGRAGYATQNNYDNAYIQCMYAKGHRVPVSGRFIYESYDPAAAPSTRVPPPPPGSPPPPPFN